MDEDLLLEEEHLPFPEGEDLLALGEDPLLEEGLFLLPETHDIFSRIRIFRSPALQSS